MVAAIDIRYEDDTGNPVATETAVHIEATGLDFIDETQDPEADPAQNPIRSFYLSAEKAGVTDEHRSPVFQSDRYTWDGWIAPESGPWTFHARLVSDDSSVASASQTFDAP